MAFDNILTFASNIVSGSKKRVNLSIGFVNILCSLLSLAFITTALFLTYQEYNGANYQCLGNSLPEAVVRANAMGQNHFYRFRDEGFGSPYNYPPKPATFKHLPMLFAITGASFWVLKALMVVVEGGHLDRLLSLYNPPGQSLSKENERKDAAKAIAKHVATNTFGTYTIKLIVIHLLPILNTVIICIVMAQFLEIPFDHNIFSHTLGLIRYVYGAPYSTRTDTLKDSFPRKTVHQQSFIGVGGRQNTHDAACVHSTAAILEMSYLILLFVSLVVLVLMIFDKIFQLIIFSFFMRYGNPHNLDSDDLTGFQYVFIFILQKNVEQVLMQDIWKSIDAWIVERGDTKAFPYLKGPLVNLEDSLV